MHGIQAWVALPAEAEETDPAFAHHGPDDLPTYESPDGLWARLIAGSAFGAEAKVKTHSPMFYVHWQLDAGRQGAAAAPSIPSARPIVAEGAVEIDGTPVRRAARCWSSRPASPCCSPRWSPSQVMLLGGEPVGPRYLEWNFVASSRERIEAGQGRLARRPHEAARPRRRRVHPLARGSPPPPPGPN